MNLSDDDFTLFGLPQQQAQDPAAIDARRRDLQAQVHPDKFAAQGAVAQRVAMQWAVRVNEAYQRLKDPLLRAAYLCELRGVPINAERNTAMPTAFLMQQMQWREALDDAANAEAMHQLDASVAQQERQMLTALQNTLDSHKNTTQAAEAVRALMFVARFRQDIERRLDALQPSR
jgi:molecular chaperone HscB